MMNWLERIFGKKETRSVGINGSELWMPAPTLGGTVVTHQTAMSLTAVYACVNVIASSIASMPFIVYKKRPDGGRQADPSHVLHDLLQFAPNPEMDANGFWTDLVGQAVLTGNGFAEILRDDFDGSPLELHLLDTRTTTAMRDDRGRLYYRTEYSDGSDGNPTQSRRIIPENVLHIRTISSNGNGIVGDSPVMLARDLIGAALAAIKSAAAVFGNGSMPLGYFTVPETLDEAAIKNIREYWNRAHQGPYNAGKIGFPVLQEGAQFNPMKVSLEDLQYNETQRQHNKAIAQLFGVPAHKIGILDDASFSNIQQQDLDFYKSTLRLWCERIESQVNTKLLSKEERTLWYAEHDMSVIVRGDQDSLTDNLVKAFGVGGYTVNQVCQELGNNPIGPDGDHRYILNNFVRYDQAISNAVESKPVETTEPTTDDSDQATEVAPDQIQDAALHRAQIASFLEVISAVTNGTIPAESAKGILEASFPSVSKDQIAAILKPLVVTKPPDPSSDSQDSVRAILKGEVGRMVRRETQAVGRLAKRHASHAEIEKFYGRHREVVLETIQPPATVYRALGHDLDVDQLVAVLSDPTTDPNMEDREATIMRQFFKKEA